MKNDDILFLSSDDWGWKTSKYHLSKRLASENRVLFTSSIGFRAPTASREHAGRIIAKLKAFFAGAREMPEGPYVVTPIVIPFAGFPFRERLNRVLFSLQMKWTFRKLGFSPKYVFVFSPNWYPYLSMFDAKIVYYCVDEQAAFSAIDESLFRDFDHRISELSDVIFCSSHLLYRRKEERYAKAKYSPHGVEYELFRKAVVPGIENEPDDIQSIPRPRLLFFGHLSYDWVDPALLKHIASKRKHWSIVLIGRNSFNDDEFDDYSNVKVLGERDFQELPAYCAHSDIGLIPFVNSELVANCNPLKLPEYLSAGLPVVSTSIPEVEQHAGAHVRVAADFDEFVAACDELLAHASPDRARAISDSMMNRSWENRVAEIGSILDEL